MNGSRLNSNPRGERSSLDALNRTIENLEARIEGMLKASGRDRRTVSERVNDAKQKIDTSPAASAEPRSIANLDALNEIRQRQRMLDASRERDGHRAPPPAWADRPAETVRAPAARASEPRRPSVPATDGRSAYPETARAAAPQREPAVQDIAQALHELRRELKQDISNSIFQEMQELRNEIQSIREWGGSNTLTEDLRGELSRLARGVDNLSQRAPSGASDLREELDDLRRMIDGLATADSVHRMEARWNELEGRFQHVDTTGIQKELIALAYRIDGVKAELGAMAEGPAIRALEDKILILATAVEELNARPGHDDISHQFSHLDQRLDEISRAVAFNSRPRNPGSDEQASFVRLEERLELLTDRIESLGHMNDAQRLEDRLEDVAAALAHQSSAELTGYLADLSRKVDALAHERTSEGFAERFDQLSRRIDDLAQYPSNTNGSPDRGFDRLETRLDEIAARLDDAARGPQGDSQALVNLEKQIAHLSQLLSEPRNDRSSALPADLDERIASIESYMSTSDEYILEAARHAAESVIENYSRSSGAHDGKGADPAAFVGLAEDLRHLEELARASDERTQATFDGVHRTLVKIAERLDRMEDHMSARPGSLLASAAPLADHASAADVRPPFAAASSAPEKAERIISRSTDELLAETAGPLDLLDPAIDGNEATEGGKRSLLTSLTQRLRPKAKAEASKPARSIIEPTPSIDPAEVLPLEHENVLLEPGSGVPDVRKILERVRASQATGGSAPSTDGERIDYIAAARRAAKAAAQETDPLRPAPTEKMSRARNKTQPSATGLKGVFGRHRRPILMAVGAILLALMAMPLVSTLTRGDKAAPAAVTRQASPEASSVQTSPAPATEMAQEKPPLTPKAEISVQNPPVAAQTAPPAQPEQSAAAADATATDGEVASDSAIDTAQAPASESAIQVPDSITPKPLADAAAKGDPQALFELAARYTEGRGVPSDLKQAAHYYQLAADQGFAPAQYRLGSLYEKGTGVERDVPKAVALYEQAARAGNASSMHNLAVLYASGATGTANYKAAVEWFTKAADLGITDSQFNLAILYARGNGTQQNLEESYKWFSVAAKDGDKDAAQKRDEVANALKPDQLQSAKAKAELWKPQPLNEKANSVHLPDEWVAKGQTTATVDMEKAIRNIQAILNRNGYDAGQADGMMGKKTVAAIKAFQKKNGMAEDGNISEPLVRKLLEQNQTKGA